MQVLITKQLYNFYVSFDDDDDDDRFLKALMNTTIYTLQQNHQIHFFLVRTIIASLRCILKMYISNRLFHNKYLKDCPFLLFSVTAI